MRTSWLAAGVLGVASVAAAPVESQAADVRFGIGVFIGDYRHHPHPDTFRLGYERGLREGSEHGFVDGRKGRSFNFWHDRDYRRSHDGYRGWMGPKWEYASGFRKGYERGYRQAYDDGCQSRDRHRRRYWKGSGSVDRDDDDDYRYRRR